jgi:hypothetical protein
MRMRRDETRGKCYRSMHRGSEKLMSKINQLCSGSNHLLAQPFLKNGRRGRGAVALQGCQVPTDEPAARCAGTEFRCCSRAGNLAVLVWEGVFQAESLWKHEIELKSVVRFLISSRLHRRTIAAFRIVTVNSVIRLQHNCNR